MAAFLLTEMLYCLLPWCSKNCGCQKIPEEIIPEKMIPEKSFHEKIHDKRNCQQNCLSVCLTIPVLIFCSIFIFAVIFKHKIAAQYHKFLHKTILDKIEGMKLSNTPKITEFNQFFEVTDVYSKSFEWLWEILKNWKQNDHSTYGDAAFFLNIPSKPFKNNLAAETKFAFFFHKISQSFAKYSHHRKTVSKELSFLLQEAKQFMTQLDRKSLDVPSIAKNLVDLLKIEWRVDFL